MPGGGEGTEGAAGADGARPRWGLEGGKSPPQTLLFLLYCSSLELRECQGQCGWLFCASLFAPRNLKRTANAHR